MFGRSLDEADDWLRSWSAQASAAAEAAQQMSERVAALSSTGTAAGGAVKVTVSGAGLVTGLELDDSVQRFNGRTLSAEIMKAIAKAQAGLTPQVAEVVQGTVGMETETGRAVIGSFERRFPEESEEDGREGRDGRGERGRD